MKYDIADINNKINDAILKYDMLEDKNTIVIGVSGGADSMTLLKFFIEHSEHYNLKIIVAHVNHCLRGKESDRDESFVRDYCLENNVSFELLRVDIKKESELLGESTEECARKVRYQFFKELAKKNNAQIATAHTLSDSVETMLINLTRGTGPSGLCGIPPKRGNIIRPLIFLKRAQTQYYCEEHNILYVMDSTNLEREYTRNKLRMDVIPVLKEINPELEETVLRMMSILKSDEKYLMDIANNILAESKIGFGEYKLSKMAKEPFSILSRCIRLSVFEFVKSNVSSWHIERIINLIENGKGAIVLPGNIKVVIYNNILKVEKIEKPQEKEYFEVPFNKGDTFIENLGKLTINIISKEEFNKFNKINNLLFFYALDYATINKDTNFRNRRPGDTFCRAGRRITKTIKKLFNELKIPLKNRDRILMLANKNEILWINNIGVSEKAKVTDKTEKVVLIYLEEKEKC